MKKVIFLLLFVSAFYLSEAQCLQCQEVDKCGSFYGYKIHYDPTTNRTCISYSNSDSCPCNKSDLFKPIKFKDSYRFNHKSVKINKPILFQIDDINLLKYNVIVEGMSENLGSDPGKVTDAFQKVFSASIPLMNSGMMEEAANYYDSVPKKVYPNCKSCKDNYDDIFTKIKDYDVKLDDIMKDYYDLIDTCMRYNGLCQGDSQEILKYRELSMGLVGKAAIESTESTFSAEMFSINTAYQNIVTDYSTIKTCDLGIEGLRARICANIQTIGRIINPSTGIYTLSDFEIYQKQSIKNFENLKINMDPIIFNKFFKDSWDEEILTPLETFKDETKKMMTSIQAIVDAGIPVFYRYNMPMIESNADRVTFQLSIKPRSESSSSGYHINNQPIRISTKGGVHFDYGIGLMVNGQRNPAYDLIYNYGVLRDTANKPIKTSTGDTIQVIGQHLERNNNNNKKPNVGICAQAFIMARLGNYHYLGGTIGAGFTSDINGAILIGASYMWGSFPKIAISSGFSLSTRREPTKFYRMDEKTPDQSPVILPVEDHKIKYDYKVVPNWFVSITIGFGKVKEFEIPAGAPSADDSKKKEESKDEKEDESNKK
jgi:hypothetical protein